MSQMLRITVTAWVFIFAGASAEGAELRLREEVIVAAGMVRLADVAEIAGDDAGELGGILLCPAPGAGKERLLRRSEINELLALAEVETRRLTWTGAEKIILRRGSGARPAATRPNTKHDP